ncbi:MAG: uncharacterized protein KVP18_001618 [Porospora cf. gigantea A]|nr:MAG: hypothetical protein KVP18_001618 [Porospora cf. gigantea A]
MSHDINADEEQQRLRPTFVEEPVHSKSPKFEHGNGVWGDPECGPVGRLDAGHLEVLQVSMNLRREHQVQFSSLTMDA